MPSAIKQDHEFSESGLVTILVESQGADKNKLEQFLWDRFPDNNCFATTGTRLPIPESRGIPHAALVGVDGKLLWAGNPIRGKREVEELIADQLKLVKKGWGDSSEARSVRRALYAKLDLAGAQKLVAAMDDGGEKEALQKEIDTRFAVEKKAIAALQEDGQWLRAHDHAKRFCKGIEKDEAWSETAAEIMATFSSDEGKQELSADKKLAKVIKNLRKGKVEKALKDLRKMVQKAGPTKVAARAQRTLTSLSS